MEYFFYKYWRAFWIIHSSPTQNRETFFAEIYVKSGYYLGQCLTINRPGFYPEFHHKRFSGNCKYYPWLQENTDK